MHSFDPVFLVFSDPQVSSAAFADSTIYIQQGVATSIDLTWDLDNAATAGDRNDIPAVGSSEKNFNFAVDLSDADLSASGSSDGLSFSEVSVSSLTSGTFNQALVAGGSATAFAATVSVTLSSADCPTAAWVCIKLTTGADAKYTDADTAETSNIACADITAQIVCVPGRILPSQVVHTYAVAHF